MPPRHCPGQKGFPRTRRAYEQDALRDLAAQDLEPAGILQKLDDLLQFLLGFIDAGYVRKADLRLPLHVHLCLAFSYGHKTFAWLAHPPKQKEPEPQKEQDRQDPGQEGHQPCGLRTDRIPHALFSEFLDKVGVVLKTHRRKHFGLSDLLDLLRVFRPEAR